jgi:hypothetical protein
VDGALDSIAEHFELMRFSYPELCLPCQYPEPGGLLPLSGDRNGGHAFWLTERRPDKWPLVFYANGFEPVERHPMSLVTFLVQWLSGELPACFHGAGGGFLETTDPAFRTE